MGEPTRRIKNGFSHENLNLVLKASEGKWVKFRGLR
jgi:hypothetical protein